VFKNGGLQYRILDSDGKKIGVPVKAYSISNRPTLARLETLFKGNDRLRDPHKKRSINVMEQYLSGYSCLDHG